MKIFIAGVSGAIGSQLVPQLVVGGHEVVGMTRSGAKIGGLRALGAESVVVDAWTRTRWPTWVAKAGPNPPADADYGWPRRATWRTG
jgi:nucleoside-diphosphate-sugar epimerase